MACFVLSRLSAAFLLFSVSSVLLLCRCFFVSFPLPFFFLYFFSLHVSVLFPSCVIFPVSLFLVSDTRVLNMPRPGCRTCRDPGGIQCPSVSPYFLSAFRCFLSRAYAYIIMCPFCLAFHLLLKICSSTYLSISVLRKSFHISCKKSPYIFGLYFIKSYFCTRFREREQRCFDILAGTA